MPKKKSHPLPDAAPAPTTEQRLSYSLRQIDDDWDKEQTELSRVYINACDAAWRKYLTALKAHSGASGGADFNDQYDQEREAALRAWETGSRAADVKLEKAKGKYVQKPAPLVDTYPIKTPS